MLTVEGMFSPVFTVEPSQVQVISLGTSPVVPTIITVTTIAEADPSGCGGFRYQVM